MKKIRVVHVIYSFGTGGLEKGIATLVRHASDLFEHVVLCLGRSGETERLLPAGTQVIELHKPPGNSPLFVWKLAETLKKLEPDIVHTRNWGGMDGIVAAQIAGRCRIVHGEHGWEMIDTCGRNAKRLLARRLLSPCVQEYTCVSRHIQRWLTDDVRVAKRITQIYNGIDTELFRPASAGAAMMPVPGVPAGAFTVGVVSRLDPIKDHPTLFEAFGRLRGEFPGARLLVVGDGPERIKLEATAGPAIHFLGNRPDVPNILRCLDVFVLPTLNEGISNTILEAMASGLPVIASRVGGNPELVEDGVTGMLFKRGDSQELASILVRYARERTLGPAQGTAGCARVKRFFTIERMVAGYEEVYRRVVENGKRFQL